MKVFIYKSIYKVLVVVLVIAFTLGLARLTAAMVDSPAILHVIKHVVNDNGGIKTAGNFTINIIGTNVSAPTFSGDENGTTVTLDAGAYSVDEISDIGYIKSLSPDCSGTILAGAIKTCTITNDDIAPAISPATLHVIKHVINNNGGSATASNFTISVTGTNVSPSSFAGSKTGVDVTLDAGSYSVTETGPSGYLESGSGNCLGTIAAGENKTCTITNDDIAPQLIVNKFVINDNGGTKVIPDFPLFIDGGSVTSGVASTTSIGLHTVSETSDPGYTATITGNCAADGRITLTLGDVKTCIITNDDIAPVVPPSSGGGGSTYVPPVPPLIDVVKVPNPLALPAGPGPVTYTYTLRNIGTVPVLNITMVGDTCSPITLVSGDTNSDAKLDVNEVWIYTCSTTLSATHTNIVTATGWANGISATDIASAMVVVGVPVVPPLIHITDVPSPLTLPAEGGMVTYTKKVTNPGTVALSNVRLADAKCDSIKYISGDTNGDSKLDTNETWIYTCQTNLTKTTTNTVIANGDANGLTARDFALATVVLAAETGITPALPNTGLPPERKSTPWNIVMLSSILILVSTPLVIFLRLRRGFGGR